MKNTIIGFVVASFLVAAPFAASAQSVDFQTQINALMEQIKTLQVQLANLLHQQPGSGSGSATSTATSPSNARVCTLLNRNLSQGTSGDDVSGLQEFLSTQGFLSANATGFFGPATAQAVAKWQASEGVSSVGSIGPLSRDHIRVWCGGGNSGNNALSASPVSGSAPLSVTFTMSIGLGDTGDSSPSINFGDGNTGSMTKGSCIGIAAIQGGQGGIRCSYTVAHTYATTGAFMAVASGCNTSTSATCTPVKFGSVTINVGDVISQSGTFSASPTSGDAPLSVNFTYHPTTDDSTQYYVTYGDDSAGQIMTRQQIECIKAPCISPSLSSHTYANAGTYTAVVTRYIACQFTNPRCMIATIPLGNVQITVGGGTSTCKPLTYMPILCDGGTPAQPVHDSNGCLIKYECPVVNYVPPTSCKAWNDGCNTCARTSPDAPAACTMRACLTTNVTDSTSGANQTFWAGKGYCTAYFEATTTPITGKKPPTVSSFSGPTTLGVNVAGTWSVGASDPQNGQLTYQVTWGDETNAVTPMSGSAMTAAQFVQNTTFTHSYSTAGIYNVKLNVTGSGGVASASQSVQVGGGVACTTEYSPVCGQPAGPHCSAGMMCPMYMLAPQTYSNRCVMNASGATFLYTGMCTTNQ